MLARRDLGLVYSTLDKSVRRLKKRYESARGDADSVHAARTVAQLVVELQSVWTNYSRHAILSLAYEPVRRTRTNGRATTALGPTTPSLFLDHIMIGLYKARKAKNPKAKMPSKKGGSWHPLSEPRWRVPRQVEEVAALVSASNLANYTKAAAAGAGILDDLDEVRNYFAHRTRHGSRAASALGPSYSVSALRRPWEIVLLGRIGSLPTFHCWADRILMLGALYAD